MTELDFEAPSLSRVGKDLKGPKKGDDCHREQGLVLANRLELVQAN